MHGLAEGGVNYSHGAPGGEEFDDSGGIGEGEGIRPGMKAGVGEKDVRVSKNKVVE